MSKLKKLIAGVVSTLMVCTLVPNFQAKAYDENLSKANVQTTSSSSSSLPDRVMIGYWHNFDNNSRLLKLRDVDDSWDLVYVSFGETAPGDPATIVFSVDPAIETEQEFIEDVKYLHSKGKKVVLSLGGQNGVVYLNSSDSKDKFVNSLSGLIDKYGFDGIDLDLENHMDSADDFKNPKVAQNVNLIAGCKELKAKYGKDFILATAPETAYVQAKYLGSSGGYLPVLYGLRDEFTFIHVQLYNSGSMTALDNANYTSGSADFVVAMTEMLLNGFKLSNDEYFPAFREDQIVIGVPCCTSAAGNGYVSNTDLTNAINYLATGKSFGGKYQLANPEGYPGLRGAMTWSANWDAATNFSWSKNVRSTLDSLPKIVNELQAGELSSTTPKNRSYDMNIKVPKRNTASSYELYEDNALISSGSLLTCLSNSQTKTVSIKNQSLGFHYYTLVLKDDNGNSVSSTATVDVYDEVVEPADPDVNKDGWVDALDVAAIATYYNTVYGTADYNKDFDVNGDGIIDVYDMVNIACNFRENPYPNDTWVAGKQYFKGDKVIYHNEEYVLSKWDTNVEVPGDQYGPWQKVTK